MWLQINQTTQSYYHYYLLSQDTWRTNNRNTCILHLCNRFHSITIQYVHTHKLLSIHPYFLHLLTDLWSGTLDFCDHCLCHWTDRNKPARTWRKFAERWDLRSTDHHLALRTLRSQAWSLPDNTCGWHLYGTCKIHPRWDLCPPGVG